jgi:hypothetical protein
MGGNAAHGPAHFVLTDGQPMTEIFPIYDGAVPGPEGASFMLFFNVFPLVEALEKQRPVPT